MNAAFHAALVSVVENDYLFCGFDVMPPGAPEHAAAGKVKQVQDLVDQIPQAGLGNAEGGKYAAPVVREKIIFRFLKYKDSIACICSIRWLHDLFSCYDSGYLYHSTEFL